MEKTGHWFRAISESEPMETYLKRATNDLGELSASEPKYSPDLEGTSCVHYLL